jgi:predicted nucleotidyltransferase component of viral defense system
MIPRDYITEWRAYVPWVQDIQVEQDLVICRALIAIFSDPLLKDALAFRGGTALYKLHLKPAARYSEDIDLVQVKAGAAGPMMQALRAVLDPWLGVPRWKQTEERVTFVYRFDSEDTPPIRLRLKVEINSREHFAVHGFTSVPFAASSRWFEGSCQITSYELEELLGTKLRALYQRKKGRDLFDLATALKVPAVDPARIIAAFSEYMDRGCITSHANSLSRISPQSFTIRSLPPTSAPCLHPDIAGTSPMRRRQWHRAYSLCCPERHSAAQTPARWKV